MNDAIIRTEYYEDLPDHITRLTGDVQYVTAFKKHKILLSTYIDDMFLNQYDDNKIINLTFTQIINTRRYFRKNYSFSLNEIKDFKYYVWVVYLSVGEEFIIPNIQLKTTDNIADYLTMYLSDHPLKYEEEINELMGDYNNIIYEERTPFIVEVNDDGK